MSAGFPGSLLASPLLLLSASSFIFAVKIMIAKAAVTSGILPLQLGLVANLGAGIILLVLVAASRQAIPFTRQHLLLYVVLGIVSFAFPNVMAYAVVDRVGPAYTATVYSLSPVLTMAFAAGAGLERMFVRRFAGIIFGLAGVIALVQQQILTIEPGSALWVVLGLTIPASAAMGNILRTALWPENMSSLAFSCATLLVSTAMLALIAPMFENPAEWNFTQDGSLLWILSLIGVSALSYVLNFRLQKVAGPVVFSQIGYWGTGFGVLLAAVLFGDVLTLLSLVGLGAVIGGGILANRAP